MARQRDDVYVVPASDDRRRLDRHLTAAFMYERTQTVEGERVTFAHPRAMHDFFDAIARLGGDACKLGAVLFMERCVAQDAPRDVRAALLTTYARVLHDVYKADSPYIREAEVAHAGSFVGAIISEMPRMILEWIEDMADGVLSVALDVQPTSVIRGVLLSPMLDQRRAMEFWTFAGSSMRFPLRVFFDPCLPDEGALFSSWHYRAFASVFSTASEAVVERFVTNMIARAVWKTAYGFVSERRERFVFRKPVEDDDRRNAFLAITGHVRPPDRREFVAKLYGIAT